MKQVIFLCSANYYRSRFAEHLFNWLADEEGLPWRADSRGLLVGHWGNLGPMSQYAPRGVEAAACPSTTICDCRNRSPWPISARRNWSWPSRKPNIALMRQQFPLWADQVEYWHVDDLDCAQPEEALPVLEENIRALVGRLLITGGD